METTRTSPARIALIAFASVVALGLMLPTIVSLPMSLSSSARSFTFSITELSLGRYVTLFTAPEWLDAMRNSLIIAVASTVLATAFGTAAAVAISRLPARLGAVAQAVLILPLILPLVVVAIGVYAVFLDWRIIGTYQAFILTHTVLAMPFVVVSVATSLRTMDRRVELAAASLGASPWSAFRRVTLPAIRPGVLTGAFLAFFASWDETMVSLFLSTPQLRTFPVQIFTSITKELDTTIAAASVFVVSVAVLLLGLVFLLQKRSTTPHGE